MTFKTAESTIIYTVRPRLDGTLARQYRESPSA